MTCIDTTETWIVGKKVRAMRVEDEIPVNPFTAGAYVATMIAQVDELAEHGHPYTEIVNESVIEATDSLTPYMHARGVGYMVDTCSLTARLGSRKWAPRFRWLIDEIDNTPHNADQENGFGLINKFKTHIIHEVLAELRKMRPPTDIAVR
jgi:ketol-acid reductoisomerase